MTLPRVEKEGDLLSLPRAGQYGCILADPPWRFETRWARIGPRSQFCPGGLNWIYRGADGLGHQPKKGF